MRIISIVFAALLLAACSTDSDTNNELAMEQLELDRLEKDEYFRNG